MNSIHKDKWLIVFLSLLVLMILFPPYYAKAPNGREANLGYDSLFTPPHSYARIDISKLSLQAIAVAAACLIGKKIDKK